MLVYGVHRVFIPIVARHDTSLRCRSTPQFCLGAILLALFMRIMLLRANERLRNGETTVAHELKGESQAEMPGVGEDERLERRENLRFIA